MTYLPSSASAMTLQELASLLSGFAKAVLAPEGGEGSPDPRVTHTSEDSRKVGPGTLFVARKGERTDGTRFAAQALEAGASAVLCEASVRPTFVPRLEVADLKMAWGIVAQALAGFPTRTLETVGITGTNGKTTVSSLVADLLRHGGKSVARSGTLGFFVDDERICDTLTTPQPDLLAEALALAQARGAGYAVLEVSSHALDQGRVSGIEFAVGALTNLSQDHLDYHATMEDYAAAKARLFRDYRPKSAVLNLDDSFGQALFLEFPEAVSVSARGAPQAAISAREARFERHGIYARVRAGNQDWELDSPLLGRHNLENLLVAWGIAAALGMPHSEIVSAFSDCHGVPGRLERCDGPRDDVVVVVDYAHTEDALLRALLTLKELEFSSVVCVFGCGGDRDKKKRAPMGRVAATHADRIFLTSDNPRTEDPEAILEQVARGLVGAEERSTIQKDRGEAIFRAISEAEPGGVVLIAGKGHEDYQIVGDQVLPFDDREQAKKALAERRKERG